MRRSIFDGEFASPEENAGAIKPDENRISHVRGWLLRLADEPPRPIPQWPMPPEPETEFAWQLYLEYADDQLEMLRGDSEHELVAIARQRGLAELFKWNLGALTYELLWRDSSLP